MLSSQKPNILFFFTDMQRADTIGALGNPIISTPGLNLLVNEGTSFTSAYTPSPVCVPARCCLQYGLYPQHTGCYDNTAMMTDKGTGYPAHLTQAGYQTIAIGKCHFSPQETKSDFFRGFDKRLSQEEVIKPGTHDDYREYLKKNNFDPLEPMGMRSEMYYMPQPSAIPAAHHPTQWIGDRTIETINDFSAGKKPWMIFSSFIHPHPPLTPPRPWYKKYRSPEIPLPFMPADYQNLLTAINFKQNRYKYRDQGFDYNVLRLIKAYYYSCISFVDHQILRILNSLEKTGQLNNTMIIFSSDHGEFLGDLGCFGKRSMHDPSSRIPLIVRLPGYMKKNHICTEPVSFIDVYPTILRAAGVKTSEINSDGVCLKQITDGSIKRKAVFSQFSADAGAQYMAVHKEWKYFYSAADNREFLFNRRMSESENLAYIPQNAQIIQEIRSDLFEFLKKTKHTSGIIEGPHGSEWKIFPADERAAVTASLAHGQNSGLITQDEFIWNPESDKISSE